MKENETKMSKKPWPTKDAMEQVYAMKLWGSNDSEFYSGIGSHHPEIVEPYLDVLKEFLHLLKSLLWCAIWVAEILMLVRNW